MKAKIEINMDNAAFEDGANQEVARVLRALAERLDEDRAPGTLRDKNGNTVGMFEVVS